MAKNCCANPSFQRHPDADVTDIGRGAGGEYTIGTCKSCGAMLMHCWVAGGISEGVEIISAEFVSRLIAVKDRGTRTALLDAWFNAREGRNS
jgi:hypothetical protein